MPARDKEFWSTCEIKYMEFNGEKGVGELVNDKGTLLLAISSQSANIKHIVKLINKTGSRKSYKQANTHNGAKAIEN